MVEPKMTIKKIIKIQIINFPGAKDSGILKQIKMYVRRVSWPLFLVQTRDGYCCHCGWFDLRDVCL